MSADRFVQQPGVVIPARLALVLAHRLDLDRLRVEWRGQDAELDDVLLAWRRVAVEELERRAGCGSATSFHNRSQLGGESDSDRGWLTSSQVAAEVGVTTSAVTRAAREKRLPGRCEADGRWRFSIADVATWTAVRGRD